MSAIAQIIHQRGGKVTGSDQATSPTVARLQALGIPIAVGHDAANLGDTHAIVTSTAVGVDNPEVSEAIARGLKIFHRSEVLAQLMASHRSVAVCGTTRRRAEDLPVPEQDVSVCAQGLRPRPVLVRLACSGALGVAQACSDGLGTLELAHFAAQWLAHTYPCQRFACALTGARA